MSETAPGYLILTLIGPDKPGLVEAVAETLARHQGNWLESRMTHLAGMFAGILRASVPEDRIQSLTSALGALEARGLRFHFARSVAPSGEAPRRALVLGLVGNDRPGIVMEVSRALAARGVNIEDLGTEVVSAPMSGEPLFKATARLEAPATVEVADVRRDLERIANDLMVEVSLAPAD